jgi:hypothetical protein
MPEINFQVKIKGGKKTKTEIKTISFTDNETIIFFQEGTAFRRSELMKAVEDYLRMLVKGIK